MLSQLSISSVPAELWALIAAIVAFLTWLAKKLLFRGGKPKPEYITRAEFHHELTATRDRIGASYLALADKIDVSQKELLSALNRQGTNFERRLDQLETNLVRLDERLNSLIH